MSLYTEWRRAARIFNLGLKNTCWISCSLATFNPRMYVLDQKPIEFHLAKIYVLRRTSFLNLTRAPCATSVTYEARFWRAKGKNSWIIYAATPCHQWPRFFSSSKYTSSSAEREVATTMAVSRKRLFMAYSILSIASCGHPVWFPGPTRRFNA